jgi:hypothetical protein
MNREARKFLGNLSMAAFLVAVALMTIAAFGGLS